MPLRPELVAFRERHNPPAAAGALVDRDGLVEACHLGVRVRGGADPVRPDDAWHIGSCGKAITALLYARLVERGDAAWGAALPELLPDLAGGMDPGWAAITIDDVFVSRSGLPANLTRSQMLAAWEDPRPLPDQRTEVAARALAAPSRCPGRFVYSNLGYVVIGAAIERVTGLPYEEALARHVLEPLGAASAGFGPPDGPWGHGGRMLALGPLGLVDLARGAPADPASARSDNPPVLGPAGRLHLTVADWAAIQRVFLADGDGFLAPASVRRLLTPATGRGQRHAPGWAPADSLGDASFAQQGSNTYWTATAVMNRARTRTALVVVNEGRARLLRTTPALALRLLGAGDLPVG
ncbi:MAG: serine hydrolase domain-containing protein [Thermoleophilia bacterium]